MQPISQLCNLDSSIFESPTQRVLRSYFEASVEPLRIATEIITAPTRAVAEAIENDPRFRTTHPENETRGYLPLGIDSVGFFVVEGKRIERCHSTSSAYGRMLKVLRMTPGRLVKYTDLGRNADVSDARANLGILKTQLRHCGYKMVLDTVRGVGIILYGLEAI